MMKRTCSDDDLKSAASKLDPALETFMARFPGESGARQPVHTVYGGAHLFKSDTTRKLGALALRSLDDFAPDAATLGEYGLEPLTAEGPCRKRSGHCSDWEAFARPSAARARRLRGCDARGSRRDRAAA